MSSSQAYIPPPSAQPQPYKSIFGGASSQDEPQTQLQAQQPAGSDHGGLDAIMGDVPVIDNDLSDDASYHNSDADAAGSSEIDPLPKSSQPELPPTTNIPLKRTLDSSPPSSPEYRPNRFRGPESTWRRLTAEDRQNAQALEDIRARDLSAHLYNAFALRVRAREIASRAAEKKEQTIESEAFLPPKRWTAWPMSASDVPRVGERLRRAEDDEWTLRRQPDPRPSADLEESIIAIMLRNAKERFQARKWDYREVRAGRTKVKKREGTVFPGEAQDEPMNIDEDDENDSDIPEDTALQPVVQADDDESTLQLQPLTRNIITQFDRLLMGLHHARKGGEAADASSGNEMLTDTESVTSASKSKTRSQSRGRKRARSSARPTPGKSHSQSKAKPTSRSAASSHANQKSQSRGRSRGSARGRSKNRNRLGLRDWSDVLGIASMIGLPPTAVMRSARRCASLFGEDMAFRTFHEGRLEEQTVEGKSTWEYEEPTSDSSRSSLSPSPSLPPSRVHSRAASVKARSRSRASSTKDRSTSRAPSTRPGSVSRAASSAPSNSNDDSLPKGKGEHRKKDILCPYESCIRHVQGFSRTWNLNLHLKRAHGDVTSRSRSRTKSPAAKEEVEKQQG